MSWFKILTSYLVVAQITLVPLLSHAQSYEVEKEALTETGKQNTAAYSKYAEKLGYDSRLDIKNKKMYMIDRTTKKVAIEVPLSDEKVLTQYSPKNLNQRMAAEFMKLKVSGGAAWSHTVKSFPTESAMFALALGGMVAVQLFTDYANNPVGMKQHIEHQLSPVGQIGFFMFMLSQGVTANVLNMWLKKPSLGIPIGMLGMTVGYSVQTYFSQIAMDERVRACAASVFKGEKIENDAHPCQTAYKENVLKQKILEAPGVISLLGTFLITVGGKMALGAALKLVGFEIGMWMAPGGMTMKFGRLLLNAANIASFTVIQMKIEHLAAYAWKNYFDGKEFVDINDRFVSQIEGLKKSQWTSSSEDLNKELREFSKKMSEWRVTNLSEAYMANQAWSEFLGLLTANYNASYAFYSDYTNHLKEEGSLIDRQYPLNGVTPKDIQENKESLYLTHPDNIQSMQVETTMDVAAWLAANIQSGYYKKLGFNQDQQQAMVRVQAGLANEDINVKGKAILELNSLISKSMMNVVGSHDFGRELNAVYVRLGQPLPMFEKGRGFAASILLAKPTMETYKDAKVEKVNGRFSTPDITDFYVVQMMCGPDVSQKEKVISTVKGFPAKFSPPALALDEGDKDNLCFGASTQAWPKERIYNLPFSKQRTAPDYLRANIDPEAAKDFAAWWDKGTESQLKEAFAGFKESYKEVSKKLYAGLNNTQMSAWNRGLVSNGAIIASFQELRMYNLVLGEILKDTYKAQTKTEIPQQYLNVTLDEKIAVSSQDFAKSQKPLLAHLGRGSRFDFNTLVSKNPNAKTRSLKIQKQLENEFLVLNQLIQKAQKGLVKTKEFMDQKTAIENKLSEFGVLLGVAVSGKAMAMPKPGEVVAEATSLVTLDDKQKALAVTCLELLQTVSQELVMYGNMATTGMYQNEK
jgi:hypothetical protein